MIHCPMFVKHDGTIRTKTSGKTIAILKMRRLWLRPKRDLRSVFFVKRWLDKTLAISYRILSKKEVLELGDVCIFSNFFRKISRIFVCNIGTIPIDFYGISRDVKRTRKFLLLVMLFLWNKHQPTRHHESQNVFIEHFQTYPPRGIYKLCDGSHP